MPVHDRQRFPDFDLAPPVEQVGPKFSSLARAARLVPVPPAIAVPVDEFRAALPEEALATLQVLFDELRATVGAFFGETIEAIRAVIGDIRLSDEAGEALLARLAHAFPDPARTSFAVRSSGLVEDDPTHSMAGVYHSVLDVRGPEAVVEAVARCWLSYYAAPAVAARARRGDFDAAPSFAVVIQEFIEPELAGVAFSGLDGESDLILVEYVEGRGEELVSGVRTPARVSSADLRDLSEAHAGVIAEAVRLTRVLKNAWRCDLDVEWAADHRGVRVVQVRPVTAVRTVRTVQEEELWLRRLYFETPPAGVSLGAVSAVYSAFTAKRGPANLLAAELGIAVTRGWVIGFTGRALAQPADRGHVTEALEQCLGEDCLVDLGDHLRQLVLSRATVIENIRVLLGADEHSTASHVVVVRDYLRGQLGMVSRRSGDDFIVEYAAEGLMALNRGTAGAEHLYLRQDGSVIRSSPNAEPLLPHLPQIAALTLSMEARHGDVTLEWVLNDGELVFLDYSILKGHQAASGTAELVISSGTAAGPVLNIPDDEFLARLSIGPMVSVNTTADQLAQHTQHAALDALMDRVRSCDEPPIIRVSRPYAVLSLLIGSVAGFVFEQGSALCHLAILLREAGIPAVCTRNYGPLADGSRGVISSDAFSIL